MTNQQQEALAQAVARLVSDRLAADNRSPRITLLVTENPKRGKSTHRYAIYQTGMTVDAYLAAGGRRANIAWDLKRGFIKLN